MTSKAPDSTTFRFSTADWPEQDRLAIWREAVGRSVIHLRLPRKALTPFVPTPEDALMRPVPRDSEALRLLTFYVGELSRTHLAATRELQHVVITHVYDLAALVIGATRDGTALAAGR